MSYINNPDVLVKESNQTIASRLLVMADLPQRYNRQDRNNLLLEAARRLDPDRPERMRRMTERLNAAINVKPDDLAIANDWHNAPRND